MHTRQVHGHQAAQASALVQRSFNTLTAPDWTPQACAVFLGETTPQALEGKLSECAYACAMFDGEAMVGFLLMPHWSLLGMLFVHPDWLRRGIARTLWEAARAQVELQRPAVMTVELNATPYAVPFYESVGFAPISREFVYQGSRATRMACWLRARALGAQWLGR